MSEEYARIWNEAIDAAIEAAKGFKYPAHGPSLRQDIAAKIEELKRDGS